MVEGKLNILAPSVVHLGSGSITAEREAMDAQRMTREKRFRTPPPGSAIDEAPPLGVKAWTRPGHRELPRPERWHSPRDQMNSRNLTRRSLMSPFSIGPFSIGADCTPTISSTDGANM
jgi:hypothetical protein